MKQDIKGIGEQIMHTAHRGRMASREGLYSSAVLCAEILHRLAVMPDIPPSFVRCAYDGIKSIGETVEKRLIA